MSDTQPTTLTTTETLPWSQSILDGSRMRALDVPPDRFGLLRVTLMYAHTPEQGRADAAVRLDHEIIPRILACVNACTGIRTEDLAAGRIKILTATFFSDLERRDSDSALTIRNLRSQNASLLADLARVGGTPSPDSIGTPICQTPHP